MSTGARAPRNYEYWGQGSCVWMRGPGLMGPGLLLILCVDEGCRQESGETQTSTSTLTW